MSFKVRSWESDEDDNGFRARRGRRSFDDALPPLQRDRMMFLLLMLSTVEYRVPLGVVSATLFELFSYLCLAMLAIDLVMRPKDGGQALRDLWRWNPWLQLYFFWIVFLSPLHLVLGFGTVTFAEFKDLIPSWIVLLCLFVYGRSERSMRAMMTGLLIGVLVHVALGAMQGLTGGPRPTPLIDASAAKMTIDGAVVSANMASGWLTHPNGFAMWLIPVVPMFLLVAFGKLPTGSLLRWGTVLMVPAFCYATYMTFGKGAMLWMLFALGCCVVSLLRSGELKWQLMFWGACACIALLAVMGRYLSASMHALETINTRIQLWEATIDAMFSGVNYFFFGAAFDRMLTLSYWYTNGHFPYPTSHNGVLSQAVCYGVPGLIFYVASIIRATRRCLVHPQEQALGLLMPGVVVFVMAATFGLLGESFFEPSSHGVLQQCQFFTLLGLAGVLSFPPAERRPRKRSWA